ncbi:hypothetical protein LPJ66_000122 [Kickxella alabastrina]|uniref:Uncharacterized protein n=1 Tax=Kickxella alabastrina TaxID=61397 RepID=A0ACC1IX54_9FUNG|nr:hypothetical protein LPJ66_000122 [Kickxella alabastrina]
MFEDFSIISKERTFICQAADALVKILQDEFSFKGRAKTANCVWHAGAYHEYNPAMIAYMPHQTSVQHAKNNVIYHRMAKVGFSHAWQPMKLNNNIASLNCKLAIDEAMTMDNGAPILELNPRHINPGNALEVSHATASKRHHTDKLSGKHDATYTSMCANFGSQRERVDKLYDNVKRIRASMAKARNNLSESKRQMGISSAANQQQRGAYSQRTEVANKNAIIKNGDHNLHGVSLSTEIKNVLVDEMETNFKLMAAKGDSLRGIVRTIKRETNRMATLYK